MRTHEDANTAGAGHEGRARRGAVISPLAWILIAGAVLFLTGLFIGVLNLYAPAAQWSSPAVQLWEKLGFVLAALGLFALIAIPGALLALGHPWAADILHSQEPRFKHTRLLGLTQLWAGTLFSAWLIAAYASPNYSLARDTYVAFLVGFGPMFAFMMFDRRR
jgi:hypothetical protein